jgi:anaerobic ribonucleoside-triphosphate reductase
MAENDEKTRQGFLYHWANEEEPPTIKVIPCEVYSRIVGYYRPIRNWHDGKKREWADRQPYDVPKVEP